MKCNMPKLLYEAQMIRISEPILMEKTATKAPATKARKASILPQRPKTSRWPQRHNTMTFYTFYMMNVSIIY